jgi:hypothetical protein
VGSASCGLFVHVDQWGTHAGCRRGGCSDGRLGSAIQSGHGWCGVAWIAFFVGLVGLIVVGMPVLFVLRLVGVASPVPAAVAAAFTLCWVAVVQGKGNLFDDSYVLFTLVAALTGFAAATFARRGTMSPPETKQKD